MAQQLFSDIPASAKSIPGTVTPDISADRQPNVDWAAVYALQQKMKADSANAWARAAAINNARTAQANAGWNQEHYLPGTESQTSGMGYGQSANAKGPVLWAPRNLQGPKLGTWASQQQNQAVAENRELPIVLQAHAGDPYSPGEGGSGAANVLGRGIFGPGLTSPMGEANPAAWTLQHYGKSAGPAGVGGGGANPAVLAKMWGGGGGESGGKTTQGKAPNAFSEEARQRMNLMAQQRAQESSGPQYQYDMWGGR